MRKLTTKQRIQAKIEKILLFLVYWFDEDEKRVKNALKIVSIIAGIFIAFVGYELFIGALKLFLAYPKLFYCTTMVSIVLIFALIISSEDKIK